MQFSLRFYWKDDRYNMPIFWNKANSLSKAAGLDLTYAQANSSLIVWLPVARFPDAASVTLSPEVTVSQ